MSNAVSKEGALQSLKLYRLQRCFSLSDDVLDIAISALEEVQKYIAIGTFSEFQQLKEIDEDLRLKYCYEDLSSAENRGYMQGYNTAVNDFANFIHEKAKEKNGLRLSADTRSWTHPSIFNYVDEFEKIEGSVGNE